MGRKLLKISIEKGIEPSILRQNIEAVKHPSSYPTEDLSAHVRDNQLAIGMISDTCLNSQYTRMDIIHTAYDFFKKTRVPYVLHCGNITDGYLKSSTHVDHILWQDYGGMMRYIKENYPDIGVPTYFIGGRNERTFFKRMVYNEVTEALEKTHVCYDLEDLRDDLIFLGMHNAKIQIASKTTLALASPKGGSRKPYTISHPMQKILESYGGGEKPDVQIVGYYNQRWSGVHLGVNAIMIGTTQNQPPEGYSDAEPSHTLGALVLKFKFNKNGSIANNGLTEVDIPFYD